MVIAVAVAMDKRSFVFDRHMGCIRERVCVCVSFVFITREGGQTNQPSANPALSSAH